MSAKSQTKLSCIIEQHIHLRDTAPFSEQWHHYTSHMHLSWNQNACVADCDRLGQSYIQMIVWRRYLHFPMHQATVCQDQAPCHTLTTPNGVHGACQTHFTDVVSAKISHAFALFKESGSQLIDSTIVHIQMTFTTDCRVQLMQSARPHTLLAASQS